MSASSKCPHPDFSFNVGVHRFDDDTIMQAEITGSCATCGQAVTFRGRMPMGISWDQPAVSPDLRELRLPCVVEGDEVDENKRRVWFGIDLGSKS